MLNIRKECKKSLIFKKSEEIRNVPEYEMYYFEHFKII